MAILLSLPIPAGLALWPPEQVERGVLVFSFQVWGLVALALWRARRGATQEALGVLWVAGFWLALLVFFGVISFRLAFGA